MPTQLDSTEARQGRKTGVVRCVLVSPRWRWP